jgi:hypothetical protein
MPRKPKQSPDDKTQSKRFMDMAREVAADHEDVLEQALDEITKKKERERRDKG